MAVLEMSSLTRDEQRARVEELLGEFGLEKLRKNLGVTLSGGERRRTEIARALALSPKFILLDEPFAGVDPIAVEDIQQIVKNLRKKNIGILITDHSVRETLSIVDRAFLIHDGKVILEGPSDKLVNDPIARKHYLGEDFRM